MMSGSVIVKDNVTIGGQAGFKDGVTIEKGVMVGAQSGVTKSVPSETVVIGYPAVPQGVFKRIHAFVQRLPQLFQRTKELEQRVTELERTSEREHSGDRERVR